MPIAGGGYGDVYQGSLQDGRVVAIKRPRIFIGSDDNKDGLQKVMKVNVLVSKNGVAHITDFGNTTLKEYTVEFTDTSTPGFSLRWTPWEVIKGQTRLSREADVYSLGMGTFRFMEKKNMQSMTPFANKGYLTSHRTLSPRVASMETDFGI
ncbi:hypothetical protein FRC10_000920 [Ceratobasidium sp. 414]|nr:hypothetical protein FRC10_000920 [Ceratobasidium sp. 414]